MDLAEATARMFDWLDEADARCVDCGRRVMQRGRRCADCLGRLAAEPGE